MREFRYERPSTVAEAISAVAGDPDADFLAGGTTEVDLMKDGVFHPDLLVDITRLPLRGVRKNGTMLQVGALTTMEELAADRTLIERAPFVREALLLGASTQLRNMATIGGNLLQRTRCRYFRDPAVPACNKREPGSGCEAVASVARMHAILGASRDCIALHASDLAVALVALDAVVHLQSEDGERTVPLTQFYLMPGDTPNRENVLRHGELITAIDLPLPPEGIRSTYLKVRDRASYEFALTSAAVALTMDGSVITEARIAMGGVGTIPWRGFEAEEVLRNAPATPDAFRSAAEGMIHDPYVVPGTAFKVELAKRTLVRALTEVTS
ncbi:FAD binding domain-containing protein [Herbidospora mongoliensis]|uniref:FAD binding domain-containing protein n=1 Tax=Herbidospora mongoliensis TaxID=688067 RepID=UPI0008369CCA|nr:xanthine dehydrogenase family protein subunit M [Herbidospora mongoliensis]